MRLVDCATSSKSTGRKLYNAAHDLELDDVRTLLEGAETQAINWRHPLRGMTPLQVAVDTKCEKRLSPYQREEALQLIDTLLLAKANPDACGRSKTTALIVSAANGDLEVVKKLLKAGANPNHGARNAFDHDGFIAKITNENVYYSLLFTVWPRAARWTSSKACWTACHETAHNGYHEVLDALIDARADVNVTDADSQTPLHVAASMGNSKAVERIIHAGASLDARDVDGETPLMLTVSQGDHTDGHVTACRLLVEAKADVEAIDNNLETVSTHAEHHNRHETAEMIETIFARMALKAAAETDPLLMNVRAVQRGLWTAEKKDVVPEDELVRCRARLLLARTAQAHSWEGLRQLLCTPLLSIECSLLERQIDLVAAERNTAPAGGELSSSSAQDERAPSMGVFGIDEWISQVAQGGLISPCNETSPVFRDPDEAEAVETLGHARSLLVEARNVQAAARQGDSCIFWFVKAENIRQGEGCFRTQLPSLQELREVAPDWIEARTISISDACSGRLVSNYTAVSHRWDDAQHPDPTGKQLESLRGFLVENPLVEFVWIDYCCMPQGQRTASETREFKLMLTNINFLYLGLRTFIMCDRTYLGRFWTQFEAWLSMQMPSLEGLVSAPPSERRCKIECVHGAPDGLRQAIVEEWAQVTAAEAYTKLSSADVTVTNQSDKDIQLPKIEALDRTVRTIVVVEGESWGESSPVHRGRESWGEDETLSHDETGLKQLVHDLRRTIKDHEQTISTLRAENAGLQQALDGASPSINGSPELQRTVSELADSTAASSTDPWLGDVTVELTNRLSQAVQRFSIVSSDLSGR